MDNIQETLLAYLRDSLLVDTDQIKPEQNLLVSGHIDSFSFIEMITFLEKKFQIKLTDDDIQRPEITTLSGLTAMIEDHRQKVS